MPSAPEPSAWGLMTNLKNVPETRIIGKGVKIELFNYICCTNYTKMAQFDHNLTHLKLISLISNWFVQTDGQVRSGVNLHLVNLLTATVWFGRRHVSTSSSFVYVLNDIQTASDVIFLQRVGAALTSASNRLRFFPSCFQLDMPLTITGENATLSHRRHVIVCVTRNTRYDILRNQRVYRMKQEDAIRPALVILSLATGDQ